MSRPVKKISVSSDTQGALEQGYKKGKSHSYRKRCQIVLLKLEGYTSKETGLIVGSCEMSVNNWINRFEAAGIGGLQTRSGQGRKRILQEEDISIVRSAIEQERQRLSQAQKIIEENIGRTMSRVTLTRFLKLITAVTNE